VEQIGNDSTSWEGDVLPRIAASGQLLAYRHRGFWQPMDTLRDRTRLEELWATGNAPWKMW
jgi:glucose-1-phosphate cytidylyltransferase